MKKLIKFKNCFFFLVWGISSPSYGMLHKGDDGVFYGEWPGYISLENPDVFGKIKALLERNRKRKEESKIETSRNYEEGGAEKEEEKDVGELDFSKKISDLTSEILDLDREILILERDPLEEEEKKKRGEEGWSFSSPPEKGWKFTSNLVSGEEKEKEKGEEKEKERKRYESFLSKGVQTLLEEARKPDDYQDWFYAGLGIDGGGIRGVIPALFAQEIEEADINRKTRLHELFDHIGGTSIGGILTAGYTVPDLSNETRARYAAEDFVTLFRKRGTQIFPSQTEVVRYFKPYNPASLESLLREYFENYNLSEVLVDITLTAVRIRGDLELKDFRLNRFHENFTFERRKAERNEFEDFKIWECARCTSAAPGYFPSYKIQPVIPFPWDLKPEYSLIDGGVWVNNPSGLVYNFLDDLRETQRKRNPIFLLSLGTGDCPGPPILKASESSGLLRGIPSAAGSAMDSSVEGVISFLKEKFKNQSGMYERLDPFIDTPIKLDDASQENLDVLEKAAESYFPQIEKVARKLLENKDRRRDL